MQPARDAVEFMKKAAAVLPACRLLFSSTAAKRLPTKTAPLGSKLMPGTCQACGGAGLQMLEGLSKISTQPTCP